MSRIVPDRGEFAARLREIRTSTHGEGEAGVRLLAEELRVPAQSWHNYESGITMPDHVLLRFLVLTNANPRWLFDSTGPQKLA